MNEIRELANFSTLFGSSRIIWMRNKACRLRSELVLFGFQQEGHCFIEEKRGVGTVTREAAQWTGQKEEVSYWLGAKKGKIKIKLVLALASYAVGIESKSYRVQCRYVFSRFDRLDWKYATDLVIDKIECKISRVVMGILPFPSLNPIKLHFFSCIYYIILNRLNLHHLASSIMIIISLLTRHSNAWHDHIGIRWMSHSLSIA